MPVVRGFFLINALRFLNHSFLEYQVDFICEFYKKRFLDGNVE